MNDDLETFMKTPQKDIPRLPEGPLRGGERNLMAHRYLYYVVNHPVIPDSVYDRMDDSFLEQVPLEGTMRSVVHQPGSSLPESYTQDEIDVARRLLGKKANKLMKE